MDEDDIEYWKAIGQLRFALSDLLKPLERYGQREYVLGALEQIVALAIQLHERVEGVDRGEPYYYERISYN